jgi:hypothetical protein
MTPRPYTLKFPKIVHFCGLSLGNGAYEIITNRLLEIPDGHPLVVFFPERRPVDAAFFSNSLVKIGSEFSAGRFGERGVLLHSLEPDPIFNLEAAIAASETNIALLLIGPRDEWKIIGRLAPNLCETLELVAQKKSLTASDLMKKHTLAANAASNRLKRLYDLRLLRREEVITDGNKSYTYHFWQWWKDPKQG